MTFTILYHRSFVGNDITVTIAATEPEAIAAISVRLDDSSLDDSRLDSGVEQYQQTFSSAGEAGPGEEHVLEVLATDAQGVQHRSITRWTDAS